MTPETYASVLDEIRATDETDPANVAECGACHFRWDDSVITSLTPAPSARCPNEYNHEEEEEKEEAVSMTPVTDALDAQGELEPGTEGWWKVWGASVTDIRAGDLVMAIRPAYKGRPAEILEFEITDAITPDGGMADQCAPRFKTTRPEPHDVIRLGMLMRVAVLRRGTHHTLADSL